MMPNKVFNTVLLGLIYILSLTSSCKEHIGQKGKEISDKPREETTYAEDSLNLIDLENIPFTMPPDWIYVKSPHPGLPSIIAQAVNPTEPQTLLTIAEYDANTIDELMSLLIKDQKKINLEHTYTISADTVHIITHYGEQIFLGKGVYARVGEKLRFICMTSSQELYYDKLGLIDQVLGSVTFD